ncbi:uncharacterized protein LOC123518300 isoform X2 [Portunus trituberculatus]|uniref:uncharacterized protein LOC123518300 isoform X2 n=1 Tax=Portunus trituberculatus TaxID=210409 RepID=UPI001E1CEF6B|nr:uncharacterized protein LOC123518300 isoform X2 [Portunus trituberculatus]
MHLFHCLTTWFLVLLVLLQRIQGDERMAKDCLEYSLNFNDTSNRTPSVSLGDALEVSLQVSVSKELPVTQIILYGSEPQTYIAVNQEKATLNYGNEHKHLTLASDRSSFSWIHLVLDPIGVDTLLVYTPADRLNAITANVNVGFSVYVSSNKETHVTFNCLSGCLIRDNLSALIRGKVKLQTPFTMYVNPIPRPPPAPLKLSITPMLTLTPDKGLNVTVNASEWTAGKWHRVKILKAENHQEEKIEQPRNGTDNVKEVQIWVHKANYRISRLRGFRWTLHCAPEGLIDNFPSTESGDGAGPSEGKEGDKSRRKGGAGAGMVTAWVMAGLALFLVMVLTLALCTKTTQSSNPNQFHDSQPSVGIVYCKGANREPEEDSEPESPNELKVPSYRNSHKQFDKTFKEVED